jgi:signal transduction histidine kinase
MVLVCAAIVAAVVMAGVALALAASQRDARRTIQQRFGAGTGTAAALVETIMAEAYANTAQAAGRGLAAERLSETDVAGVAKRVNAQSLVVLDMQRKRIASWPSAADLGSGPDDHIRQALAGRPAISGMLTADGRPVIEIAIPFRSRTGSRVLVAALPGQQLQKVLGPYLQRIPGDGDRRAYIFDHGHGGATLADSRPGASPDRALEQTLRRRPVDASGSYAAGRRAFSSLEIPGTPWTLVRTTTSAALYSPVSGWSTTLPWALLAVLVAAGLLIVVLADRAWRTAARDRQASLAKTAFLAHMSHELRTPMTTVLGFGEMLAAERLGPLTERQAEALSHMNTSSKHLNQLIGEMLDLARVEEGRMQFSPEPVEPHVLVGEVVDSMNGLANDRSVQLSVDAADIGTYRLDPGRFKQVLYNLIGNAIKFTEAGGLVTVRLWADAEAGTIGLEVADTGMGIPPEDLDRIFMPFEQSTPRNGGAGLGLAITQRILDAQGGGVTVTSEPGDGSAFRVTLPAPR